jgi:hypothetical protein
MKLTEEEKAILNTTPASLEDLKNFKMTLDPTKKGLSAEEMIKILCEVDSIPTEQNRPSFTSGMALTNPKNRIIPHPEYEYEEPTPSEDHYFVWIVKFKNDPKEYEWKTGLQGPDLTKPWMKDCFGVRCEVRTYKK